VCVYRLYQVFKTELDEHFLRFCIMLRLQDRGKTEGK
jgi:hypothetical protein